MSVPSASGRCAVRRRVGLFGGTFDPIHLGHLIAAREARARLDLECVIFVPARVSPHKLDCTASSSRDRFEMTRLGIAGNAAFRLSSIDLDREGPSFTVDTLRAMRALLGDDIDLYFIMGMDSLRHIETWRAPQEIVRLAHIAALNRPGHTVNIQALEASVPGLSRVTHIIDTISVGISSTDIRRRVESGLPIRYQVPNAVEAYICQHGLYKRSNGAQAGHSPGVACT